MPSSIPSYVITIKSDYDVSPIEKFIPGVKKWNGVVGRLVDLDSLDCVTEVVKYSIRKKLPITDTNTIRTPGALGCFLSHRDLWKKLASDPLADWYLILEDDVVFKDNFKEGFKKIVDWLSGGDPGTEGMIIVLGYAMFGVPYKTEDYTQGPEGMYEIKSEFWGTQSYIINKAAAVKLINESGCIQSPVDTYMSMVPGIKKFALKENLTKQSLHTSSILGGISAKYMVSESNLMMILLMIFLFVISVIIILWQYSLNDTARGVRKRF